MSERTLALIKPDACGRPWLEKVMQRREAEDDEEDAGEQWEAVSKERAPDRATEILARIEQEGFKVVRSQVRRLTKRQAEQFYAEHRGKPFFDHLTSFMASGPIMALILEKENAVAEWRKLIGPTSVVTAREQSVAAHPLNDSQWTLRALYADEDTSDSSRNVVHGSDSAWSAMREVEFFFPQPAGYTRSAILTFAGVDTAAVVADLEERGFVPVASAEAVELSAEQRERALLGASEAAQQAAAAGPATVTVVERNDAVKRLRLAAGPPDGAEAAREKSPQSLNARFAAGGAGVAAHAPASAAAAAALIEAVFGPELPVEQTLAVIKPGAAQRHYQAIMQAVAARGFDVVASKRTKLTKEQAEAFYDEHRGKPFFDRLTAFMASAPVVALVLSKVGAIKAWRSLMGPTNTFKARAEAPTSLRALYGVDGTSNATHGSDSPASAAREIRFYFPDLAAPSLPSAAGAREFVTERKVSVVYNPSTRQTVPATLQSTLVRGLAALARAKPHGIDAIEFLGRWLLNHNPRSGTAEEDAAAAAAAANAPTVDDGDVVRGGAEEEGKEEEEAAAAGGGGGVQVEEISTTLGSAAAVAAPIAGADSLKVVFVLGAPGSGKGTQCKRIKEAFGYTHLSTGDLLRAEIEADSAIGRDVKAKMAAGELVPTETVLSLVKKAIAKDGGDKFLVDGYPRALDQAFAFEKAICKPCMVLSFEADEDELVRRIVARGASSGRADDNEEGARNRMRVFREQSEPAIQFYDRIGLVRRVDSNNKTIEEVFEATRQAFLPQFTFVVGGPGAGRSTLCSAIGKALGHQPLSVGALIERELTRGTALADELQPYAERGAVAPSHLVIRLIQDQLQRDGGGVGHDYVLDGFPRTLEQALQFEQEVCAPVHVVCLAASDRSLRARCRSRKASAHRAPTLIKKQIAYFHTHTEKVAEFYEGVGLARRVDAERPPAAVAAAAVQLIKPKVVFVLGGPGSGKGTQCKRIKEAFGYTHLSAGDLLRAEVARGSADGAMIQRHIEEGSIVPATVTIALLQRAMAQAASTKFLIDGFPRALDQLEAFEAQVGDPSLVLFYDCPEDCMRQRLLQRGETSGRADDNEEAIVKRFHTYRETTMPVIDSFARRGLVHNVDASGSVEEVFAETRSAFDPQVVFVLGGPGSGKGTQCKRIKEAFGYTHLSTGDLLRAEVTRGSAQGATIQQHIEEGAIVPMEIVIALLKQAMGRAAGNKFLIDGYPRAVEQAERFEADVCAPRFVLFFDCPEPTMRQRLLKRGETSGRADDNEEAIVKRFHTYQETTMPVVELYSRRSLVRTVSAVPAPDAVYDAVRRLFQPQVVILCGATGSGRGLFTTRAGRELGYHTLRVTHLLQEEAKEPTPQGREVALSLRTNRTAPIAAAVDVIKRAIGRSASHRFILDGYPRVVSEGFPSAHDMVFALEEQVGPIRGCISLDAGMETRRSRVSGNPTVGEEAALVRSVAAFHREKVPVVQYFARMGMAQVVDTQQDPDDVFEAARHFLE